MSAPHPGMTAHDMLASYQANAWQWYRPTLGMLPFHRSPGLLRFLRCPNQVGKTVASAYEIWAHLLGEHAWRPAPKAVDGLIMLPDLDNDWPKFSAKLREVAPHSLLATRCKFTEDSGYTVGGRRGIQLASGRAAWPRSGTQHLQVLEGDSAGFFAVDEVPREGHYAALKMRVVAKDAPIWLTFTPVGRSARYLREAIEGIPEEDKPPKEPGWETFRAYLTERDCTTVDGFKVRPQHTIDRQIALCKPEERPQRIYGEWDGPASGRRFPSFSTRHYLSIRDLSQWQFDEIRVGFDHGEGSGKQVASIVGLSDRRIAVLAQWSKPHDGTMTAATVARETLALLRSLSIGWQHVKRWVGDINSAGLGTGGGIKYNALLEEAFRAELRSKRCPFTIESAAKGKGSVSAGETAIEWLLAEDLLVISDLCPLLKTSFEAYTGKEQDLKDAIDSMRYPLSDLLLDPELQTGRPFVRVLTL